ncbi:MAG: ABC transporter ATP-binding protein, partial [Chloroflexota bacterium]|nr:ABC transporter ATP-binding protein [Chloroflexota bacterium]
VRRKVSVVSHETFLYDNLTLYENLKFYGRMYDVPDLDYRISEVVSQIQLESRLYDQLGTLSRGLQQRASIARAVIQNPSIMLLDEPEVGLDPHGIIMMRNMLDTIAHPGRTVVMTTHNLEQGLDLGNKVVILNKGELVYEAFKHEIEIENFRKIYDHYTGMSK